MAQSKPRDPRKERQWRQRVHEWRDSGLSVREFCDRHRLAEPSFYAWRRALQQREDAGTFIPVRLAPEEEPAPAGGVEVVLAGGRRLRVRPGFDPATLRQLLAVLEEVPPC
jgi:transposase